MSGQINRPLMVEVQATERARGATTTPETYFINLAMVSTAHITRQGEETVITLTLLANQPANTNMASAQELTVRGEYGRRLEEFLRRHSEPLDRSKTVAL